MPPKKQAIPANKKTQQAPAVNEMKGVKDDEPKSNLLTFDTKKSLPIIINGQTFFAPQSGNNYYPFLNPDDNLFRTFMEIRMLSVTQNNCIRDKTLYSIGDGLQVQDQDFPTDFDKKINGKRQLIDDVLKAIFESLYQDGNKFVEVTRQEIGGELYVYAYPHNNMDCRFEFNPDGDDPTHALRSREFRRDGIYTFPKKKLPIRIPLWTDNSVNESDIWTDPDENGVQRTMFCIKDEWQGIEPYGLPSNFPGMVQALLEYRVGRFNLDNFDNNMFLAGILSIMGQLAPNEQKALLKDVKKQYTGEGKNSRVLVVSSEAGLTDTKFTALQQTHEGHFVEFDLHNEEKIINANNWSKELLDMSDAAKIGNSGPYLAQLFKRKFRTIISPMQQNVMNNFVFPFMSIYDEFKSTSLKDLKWYIKPVLPVSLEGELDLNSLLTVDEGRAEVGKQPLDDKEQGGKLIATVAAKVAAPVPATTDTTTTATAKTKGK